MSLIKMFNAGFDYARLTKSGTYLPCKTRRNATHELICLRWREKLPPDRKKAYREYKTRPEGYAWHVSAQPLRKRPALGYSIPLTQLRAVGYRLDAPLDIKRRILCLYAQAAKPQRMRSVLKKRIRAASLARCDELYWTFIRSSHGSS